MAVDETTPLTGRRGAAAVDELLKQRHPEATRVAWFLIAMVMASNISGDLQRAPWQRMLETIFCNEYYAGRSPKLVLGEIPEADCKLAPIQSQIAALIGWDMLLTYLPGLLLTIPFGALCDRWGRKPVVLLSMGGIVLGQLWMFFSAFLAQRRLMDIRFSLFSNVGNVIGGGSSVLVMALYSMVADCTTGAERSRFFFRFMAAALATPLIGIPIASFVMQRSVWLALMCSTFSFVLSIILAAMLPETLHLRQEAIADAVADQLAQATPAEATNDDRASLLSTGAINRAEVESYVVRAMRQISQYKFLVKSPVTLSLAATFLVHTLGRVTMDLLLNLASNRFKWTFAEANFLSPVSSTSTLILLALVLPGLHAALVAKLGMSPVRANLFIARGSVLFATIGLFGIALAPTPIIIVPSIIFYALGAGFSSAVRDLATVITPPEVVAKMYAVFQMFDATGGMLAGPLMSQAFIRGMEWGGLWNGLPFLMAGGLNVLVALVIWLVRIPDAEPDVDGDDDSEAAP